MERITARTDGGMVFVRSRDGQSGVGHFTTQARLPEIIAKLADYEDAEESGNLLVLPCKIGDTVWSIRKYKGIKRPQQGVVSEMYFVRDIIAGKLRLLIVVKHVARGEWGEKIFSTKEDAEKAIEEMR